MSTEISEFHPVPVLMTRGLPRCAQAPLAPAESINPLSPPERYQRIKAALTLGCAMLLLAVAGVVLWYQDGRYSLPTPPPVGLVSVLLGSCVAVPGRVRLIANDPRPVFLHFFNPECPCSVFNAEHVRALRQKFDTQTRFIAVAQISGNQDGDKRRKNLAAASAMFGPDMESIADDGGEIAAACGVYSTPQAVILAPGTTRTLLFRGNYNTSRYCADPRTEFARLALTAIVNHQPLPPESQAAMVAYGCELPANIAAAKAPTTKARL